MSSPTIETAGAPLTEVSEANLKAKGHPPALWFFFWGEFAERCSYYGMRAILPLYLAGAVGIGLKAGLGYSQTEATQIYSYFKMACYCLPLLGGYLADRFFGRYWTIVGFSIPYVAGHFILGYPNHVALFIALALLAGGSGVIKPNISTLMGQTYDQKRPGQEQLRSAAFLWFYLSINVGAVISQFCMPPIRDHYGYATAFLFPAWIMVGSLIVFALGKPFYGVDTSRAAPLTPEERREQWQTFVKLLGIFAIIVFWWAAYEQNDNLWIFFAQDYTYRYVPLLNTLGLTKFLSNPMPPDQIQFLNPLFVVITVPLFNWLFRKIDPQVRVFKPMTKVLMGFLLQAAASGIMCTAGYLAQSQGAMDPANRIVHVEKEGDKEVEKVSLPDEVKVSGGWVAAAYIVLTIGEVLLYGTMLELAYAAAPKRMKGFVTACFLVTDTLGNYINSLLSKLWGGSLNDPADKRGPLQPGPFFLMTVGMVLVATIAFYFIGKRFERRQVPDTLPAI